MSKSRSAANGVAARRPDFAACFNRPARALLALVGTTLLVGCLALPRDPGTDAGEGKTAGVVVAAHPLAVDAGTAVLRRGGTAMDAAVAVQMMLGLVEPQSSGIGGGAIIMAYDARSQAVTSYIGREAAPALADGTLFEDENHQPLPRGDAMLSGGSTGVPGTVAVFSQAQREHGKLAWEELFTETIQQAEQGFVITPRLEEHIQGTFPQASAPDVRQFFSTPDGQLKGTGDLLRNPDYAETLRKIAQGNEQAFYSGELASAIVARTHQLPRPGQLSMQDMADYTAEKTEPLCRPLRAYIICVPRPPTSGVGLLQLMALLDETDIDQRGPEDPQSWFLFAEASRIMYADRDHYVGDPAFDDVPVDGLLDPAYVDQRRGLIGNTAGPAPQHGQPPGAGARGPDRTDEPGGTSHFVVIDQWGNAASVTTTIESFFGSGRMVDGFFLNNELTDFSWSSGAGDDGAANAIAGGKRPRSSMTPIIILDRDGRFVGALGSPGGSAIPAYIGKALVGLVYWDMPLQDAVDLPNLVARGSRFNGEASRFPEAVLDALSQRGVTILSGSGEDSGLHGVFYRDGVLEWAADPRREGVGKAVTH
ncbi:gamma-glutamyltransferase family protein [Lysobacter sp. A421]